MDMWKLTRPIEYHARATMFFAENRQGQKLQITAPEEDIDLYFQGHNEVYVYADYVKNNLQILGRAFKEDWGNV